MSETRSEKEYGPPFLFTIEAILVTSQIENTQLCILGCKIRGQKGKTLSLSSIRGYRDSYKSFVR